MPDKSEEQEQKQGPMEELKVKTTTIGTLTEIIRANLGDTIAYIVMALGLFFCFFGSFGGLLVGFIMGLYFSKMIVGYPAVFQEFLITGGIFRGFIIIGSIFAVSISAPGLSIGVFLGALSRPLFGDHIHDVVPVQKKEESENSSEQDTSSQEEMKS